MKKNIILLLADQLRYDVLNKGYTPNIDALQNDSAIFDSAYCTCPLCAPARGSIFTGTYPSKNKCIINPWKKDDAEYGFVSSNFETMYDMMCRENYNFIHSGKQHLFTEGTLPQNREDLNITWASTEKTHVDYLKSFGKRMPGGDDFKYLCPEVFSGQYTHLRKYSNANTGHYEEGLDYYFDGYFTDTALSALKTRAKEKPLFLSMMFLAPHPPLDVPSPYYENSQTYKYDIPENVGKFYDCQSPLQAYNLTGIMGMNRTTEQWQDSWKAYMGLVSLLDDCVGKIISELKKQNIYDDSIIVFSTDHGEMMGSHSLFQKMCMYEESVKVPLSIKMPSNEHAKKHINNTVSHVDLLPTLCELADLKLTSEMQGESLLPLIKGNTNESRNIAYIQYDGNGALSCAQRAIIYSGYKLIVDSFQNEVYYEFYNINEDNEETTNLLFEDGFLQLANTYLDKLVIHMKEQEDIFAQKNFHLEDFIKKYQN